MGISLWSAPSDRDYLLTFIRYNSMLSVLLTKYIKLHLAPCINKSFVQPRTRQFLALGGKTHPP